MALALTDSGGTNQLLHLINAMGCTAQLGLADHSLPYEDVHLDPLTYQNP